MGTEMDARTQIRARLEPQVSLAREAWVASRGTGRCQIRTLIQFDAAGTIGVRAGLHAEEERRARGAPRRPHGPFRHRTP